MSERRRAPWRHLGRAVGLDGSGCLAAFAATAPPPEEKAQQALIAKERAKEYQQSIELDRYLCRKAAACSKYDRVRVDCATASNFKTCLRIKMGDDFRDVETCGVDYEGGPAPLLDPRTPMPFAAFSSMPRDDWR
jgi:hypothetical protein